MCNALIPFLEPVNKAGDTLLAVACIKGHINVIDYLVKVKCINPEGKHNAFTK